METVASIRPLLAVLVSAVAIVLIIVSRKRPNLREFWTMAAGVVKFGLVLSMVPTVLDGVAPQTDILVLTEGISLRLRADPFGLFFALIASGLWIATSVYSIGYMRGLNEHAQTRYFSCFALALSSTMGIAMSANILTFFIFYEVLTLSTYPLVIHKETPEAIRAGRKYLVYTLTAGVFLLLGLVIAYSLAGTLEFTPGGFLKGRGDPDTLRLLFVVFMLGVGVKSGFMPIHAWLPTAMIAPTPVSALLHAVAVVKSGVFGCLRVIWFVFGTGLIRDLGVWEAMAYFVSATILISSLYALAQDNLKRRLAFSTISQLSYIVLGAVLLAPEALKGSSIHIVNHAFMKITLFFCAGAIYVKAHKSNISELDGIGRKMPFTMSAFLIGALGMIGIPPVAGFVSKWYLCLGALNADKPVFMVVLLISSLLNAAYFLPILFRAFFRKPKNEFSTPGIAEAPPAMVIPLCITALFSIALGINPNMPLEFLDIATAAVQQVVQGG